MYLIYVNNDVNLVNGKIMLIYTNREKCKVEISLSLRVWIVLRSANIFYNKIEHVDFRMTKIVVLKWETQKNKNKK